MTDVLDDIVGATGPGGDAMSGLFPEVGSWNANEAPGPEAMYAGEGRGFARQRARGQKNPRYNEMLLEAATLYKRVLSGDKYAALQFSEAMSTSDFPLLFGDILDRQILGYYSSIRMPWELTARRSTVPDFRVVSRHTVDGAEGLLPFVPELTNYPADALHEGRYQYKVAKRGKRIPMSWEMRINDDLDAFGRMPQKLALGARRSEEHFATGLYATSVGPNSNYFSTVAGNIITGNPALTMPAIQNALTQMGMQLDDDGFPIFIEGYVLEVPQTLEVVANNIVNAIQVDATRGGGDNTGQDILRVNNWLAGKLTIKVNPWLTYIDKSANRFSTWYLWARSGDGRPAQEIGFLRGHENPEMFMKSPNALRVGGGVADVMAGDFDSDSIEWKVRHVIGGAMMDKKMLMTSNGSNVA